MVGALARVQNGYTSSGTGGNARPRKEPRNRRISSENVPARAREWTGVPYSSFPRNEGVRGSNPRVGLKVLQIGLLSWHHRQRRALH